MFSILILAMGLLEPRALVAQSFSELDLLQQWDLKQVFKKLYVLGDQNASGLPTGLVGVQQRLLEQAAEVYSGDQEPYQATQARIRSVFAWTSYKKILEIEFERRLSPSHESPLDLAELYAKAQATSPLGGNYSSVFSFLLFELSYREQMIGCPLLAESLPLPRLSFESLHRIYPSAQEDLLRKFSRHEVFSFEEFHNLVLAISSAETNPDEIAGMYFRYLSLGTALYQNHFSQDDFREHLQRSREKFQSEFPHFTETHFFLDFSDFYFWIYRECQKIEWDEDSLEDSELSALQWLDAYTYERWFAFREKHQILEIEAALRAGADLSVAQALFAEIENYISQSPDLLEDEQKLWFLAKDEILSLEFLNLKSNEQSFFLLSEELQKLLLARLFPKMPFHVSRALISLSFFDLSAEDQAFVQNEAFQDPASFRDFFQSYRSANPRDDGDRRDIHRQLLKAFFESQEQDLQQLEDQLRQIEEIELLSGEKVKSAAFAKDEMRSLLASNRIDHSFFPEALIDFLTVHLFPYPGFLQDEWKRFENELLRLELRDLYTEDFNEALKEKDESRLRHIEKQMNEILISSEGLPLTDLGSPAVYLASLGKGFVDAPAHSALALGVGALFGVVMKSVGGRVVLFFLATDSGVSLARTYFRPEGMEAWREVGFENGLTPIGGLLVEGLWESLRISGQFFFSNQSALRLQASYEFGRLSSEVLSFGVGARVASIAFPWKRLEIFHRWQKANSQHQTLESKWSRLGERGDRLREEIQRVQTRLSQSERGTRTHSATQRELQNLRHQLASLESALSHVYRTRAGRLVGESLRAVIRSGRQLFFFPWKRSGLPASSRRQKIARAWRERFQINRPAYEIQMEKISEKIAKLERAAFRQNSRPGWHQAWQRIRFDWDESLFVRRLESLHRRFDHLEKLFVDFDESFSAALQNRRPDSEWVKNLERVLKETQDLAARLSQEIDRASRLAQSSRASEDSAVDLFTSLRTAFRGSQNTQALRDFHKAIPQSYLGEQRLILLRYTQNLRELNQSLLQQALREEWILNSESLHLLRGIRSTAQSLRSHEAQLIKDLRPFVQMQKTLKSMESTARLGSRSYWEVEDLIKQLQNPSSRSGRVSLDASSWQSWRAELPSETIAWNPQYGRYPLESVKAYHYQNWRLLEVSERELLLLEKQWGQWWVKTKIQLLPQP